MILWALNTAYQYYVKKILYLTWVTIFTILPTIGVSLVLLALIRGLRSLTASCSVESLNVRSLQPAGTSLNRKIPDKMQCIAVLDITYLR